MPMRDIEKFKIYKNVFDEHAIGLLFRLSTQGYFEELASPISLGKEANIFSAGTKDGESVVVKIYRLENCNFKKMLEYIRGDPRYADVKPHKRQIVFQWVKREYRNLLIAREAGVSVPKPIAFVDNVLVMEYIGDDSPSPPLKDKEPENKEQFLNHILENMKKLHKAGLVHGDLSSFNILNRDEKPVFIDFSQSTSSRNRDYMKLLERDIKNIASYFNKKGISIKEEEIKKKVLS